MTRGGRRKDRDEPERRCVVSGESGPRTGLIRFVIGPDGLLTPDLAERLPGRGMWLTASREAVAQARRKRAFSRAARAPVDMPEGLEDLLERLIARRACDAVAMARKAGLAVTGFEKVKARLDQGPVAVLIEARDGAPQGRARLRARAGQAFVADLLDSDELGLAFGRDFVIHAALDGGGVAARVARESRRLAGFRTSDGTGDGAAAAGPGREPPAPGDRNGASSAEGRGRT